MNCCSKKFSSLFIGLAIIGLAFTSTGAVTFDGRLGVDYEFYDYASSGLVELDNSPFKYRVSFAELERAISNHYLEFSLRGAIVNTDFATFGLRSKIYGTYFRTQTVDSLATAYLSPNVRGFTTQLAFFPNRSYPIRLFYADTEDHVLKPEEKNQAIEGSLRPELQVVRRYDSKTKSLGGNTDIRLNDKLSLAANYGKTESSALRAYELGEDKDLYTIFKLSSKIVLPTPNPIELDRDTSWNFSIALNNIDEIANVSVFLDLDAKFFNNNPTTLTVDVPKAQAAGPGAALLEFELTYQTGQYNDNDSDPRNNWVEFIEDFVTTPQEVTVIPDTMYNPSTADVFIGGNMLWIIQHIDPSAPIDRRQEGSEFSTSLTYDDKTRLKNVTMLSSSSRKDLFQDLTGDDLTLSNDLSFQYSKNVLATLQATNLKSNTVLFNGSRQDNNATSAMATVDYSTRRGPKVGFAFALNDMSSDDGVTVSGSDLMSYRLMGSTPSGFLDHKVEVSTMFSSSGNEQTLPLDTTIIVNGTPIDTTLNTTNNTTANTISFEVNNNLTYNRFGVKFSPNNVFKFQKQSQSSSPSTKKYEFNSGLGSEITDHKYLANSTLRLQHSYLLNTTIDGSESISKYNFDFSMRRDISDDFSISLSHSQQYTTYGISSNADTDESRDVAKPSEIQSSYGFGAKLVPLSTMFLDGSYRLSIQETSQTASYELSLKALIPKLNMSISSQYRSETRETIGSPDRIKELLESTLTFSIRRIKLLIEHKYSNEKRDRAEFTNHLIAGKITRSF